MKLIEFETGDGRKIAINPDKVACVFECDKSSVIVLPRDRFCHVRGDYEEVVAKLRSGGASGRTSSARS